MNPQAFIARRFVRSRSERVDSRDGFKLSSIILFCFPIHPSVIREIKVCTVDLQPDRLVKMGAGKKITEAHKVENHSLMIRGQNQEGGQRCLRQVITSEKSGTVLRKGTITDDNSPMGAA